MWNINRVYLSILTSDKGAKKDKGFRNTQNYKQAPIIDPLSLDATKRSEVSDTSHLNITKNMDDSANSILFGDHSSIKVRDILLFKLAVPYLMLLFRI
jgi:hypothetical protein